MLKPEAKSDITFRPIRTAHGDGRPLLSVAIVVGVVAIACLEIFGMGHILPILAALLVGSGFAIAAIAWIGRTPHHEVEITAWDIAGLLAFVGFAAAMISN
jgi:hypothetical protein